MKVLAPSGPPLLPFLSRNTLQSGIINLTKDGPTEPGYYRPIITSSRTPMTGGVCKEKFGFPFPVLSPTVSHIRYLATNNNTQSQCDVFNTLSELISMQIKLSSWKARAFDFHREISDLRNSDRCSILVKRQLSMELFFTVEIFFQAATPSSVTATWSGCNPSTTRRTSLCIPLLMTLSPSTVG